MRHLQFLLVAASFGLSACGANPAVGAVSSDGGAPDMTHPDPCASAMAGAPITIPVLAKQHLDQGKSAVEVDVMVPAGCYANIKLHMQSSTACKGAPPPGQNWPALCDPFDRLAQVWLADKGQTPMFVLDAVTPFGGLGIWDQDITDYAQSIAGMHTYHVEVGTYADPAGKATGTMSSHDVDVSVIVTPGVPPHAVAGVVPLWRQGINGNTKMVMGSFTAPAGATAGHFDYFTSGHGGNGNPPCDEFCMKENDIAVDGMNVYMDSPFINCDDNCDHQSIQGTIGCGGMTFNYICKQNPTACPTSATAPRANWCPSKIIPLIQVPLPSSALLGKHDVTLGIPGVEGDFSIGLAVVFYR